MKVLSLCCRLACRPVVCCKQSLASLLCTRDNRRFLLTTLAVYVLTFCVIMPFLCRNLPLTKYYRLYHDSTNTLNKALQLNAEYVSEAESYIYALPKEETRLQYEKAAKNPELTLVIGIVTTSRRTRSPKYLTQVTKALHEALVQSGGVGETTMFICNTNHKPDDHHEAIFLSQYFPSVNSPNKYDRDKYEREKVDYYFCLSEAAKLNAKYILLLQDDALPHTDFYSVLKYILQNKLETQIYHGNRYTKTDEWLWLKLNFPNAVAKYERNAYFALEWIFISLILAAVSAVILSVVHRSRGCSRVHINEETQASANNFRYVPVFLATLLYWLLLVWLLGKPYISLVRTMSPSFYTLGPGTSCCLPAVLFPQTQVPEILQYLQETRLSKDNPLDFALDNYRLRKNLPQYLLSPNIFTHIGVVSTLHYQPSTKEAENYLFAMKILRCRSPLKS